jgi:butyrate kinase
MFTILIGNERHNYAPRTLPDAGDVARELSRDYPCAQVIVQFLGVSVAVYHRGRAIYREGVHA